MRASEIEGSLTALLDELEPSWPEQDIAYVRDEVAHGEYGDALENLVALALKSGHAMSPEHSDLCTRLADAMRIVGLPDLDDSRPSMVGM